MNLTSRKPSPAQRGINKLVRIHPYPIFSNFQTGSYLLYRDWTFDLPKAFGVSKRSAG
ncbi:MAG: hypothetical protein H0X66_04635 [Verrucomicrobia bacterium]|nr:hypothetical protein [Verrucomicrobiota bacterium]